MSNIKDFVIENGILIKYNGNDSEVVIPETVEIIGEKAFYGCESLLSVTIPSSVKNIALTAFWNCPSLTLYVQEGSEAEGYARRARIIYKLI